MDWSCHKSSQVWGSIEVHCEVCFGFHMLPWYRFYEIVYDVQYIQYIHVFIQDKYASIQYVLQLLCLNKIFFLQLQIGLNHWQHWPFLSICYLIVEPRLIIQKFLFYVRYISCTCMWCEWMLFIPVHASLVLVGINWNIHFHCFVSYYKCTNHGFESYLSQVCVLRVHL